MDNAQVEAVARAMFADKEAFPQDCYMDDELAQWPDSGLSATVDGEVDFTALAKAAIAAIGPSEYERGATEERAKIVAWLRGLHWTHAGKLEADRFATAISNMEPGK